VRNSLSLIVLALVTGCGGKPQDGPKTPEPSPYLNRPLATPALAGQKVAVLPLTLAVPDAALSEDSLLGVRTRVLPWADSVLGETLQMRAPEVTWVLPPELRRTARRATGLAPDPDRLGHAILRDPTFKIVPDPLRSQLRTLTALVDARYALVPAAAVFLREPDGRVKVEMMMVLVDTRTGNPGWHSLASATDSTPARAYRAALAHVIRVEGVQ
jgi:hypothetical protein